MLLFIIDSSISLSNGYLSLSTETGGHSGSGLRINQTNNIKKTQLHQEHAANHSDDKYHSAC